MTRHKRLTGEPTTTQEDEELNLPSYSTQAAPVEDRGRKWFAESKLAKSGLSLVPAPGLPDAGNLDYFAREIDVPFFVDWLSLEQVHPFEVPTVSEGFVQFTDQDGVLQWMSPQHSKVRGSFDTSLRIRAHGNKVEFSGNVSRFGRADNLFGFDLGVCLRRVNEVLTSLGLPEFSPGQKFYRTSRSSTSPRLTPAWTGCKLTRIDLTANYQTGSADNARAYLEWLSSQQTSARVKVGTHGGHGETVDWGRGSRRVYAKAYNKAIELARHNGEGPTSRQLIDYCNEVGLVRFEVTVKATQLHTMGCNYLGGLDMGQLVELFKDRAAVLTRAEHTHDDLDELPNHFRRTARDYLAGDNVRDHLSLASFKRHRAALLPYGIDIAVARNVVDFKPRVRVIELSPCVRPSWYEFDERLRA